jgi:hypothetical protein
LTMTPPTGIPNSLEPADETTDHRDGKGFRKRDGEERRLRGVGEQLAGLPMRVRNCRR